MFAKVHRGGSRFFAAMVVTNALGSFNENFFKEAAMLVAVASGKIYLQGVGAMIFIFPFLAFAAPAGWLADRFSKRRVMISAKFFEVMVMSAGAYGLYERNWTTVFAMAGLLAIQGVVFSPAINGSIPELLPFPRVPRANAVMTVAVLSAILGGVACAGFALGRTGGREGRILVMLLAMGMAVTGFLFSLGLPSFPAASPREKFPWRWPAESLARLYSFRKDRLLSMAVATNMFVYMTGSLQIQVINQLGIWQLKAGETMTGMMVVAQLVGFGLGGFLSGWLAKGERWYRILPPAAAFLGLAMVLVPAVPRLPGPLEIKAFFLLFVAAGAGGGMLLVACRSFIQMRARADEMGAVLSATNFAVFGIIIFSGPIANALNKYLPPTTSYGLMGIASLLASGLLVLVLSRPTR